MPTPGVPYSEYYPGGWQDGAGGGTPVRAAALNQMEQGILSALSAPVAPNAGDLPIWNPAANGGAGGWDSTTNLKIAKSMLASLGIVDADVAAGANISKSKLGALNIVDADVAAAAALAISKLSGYPADGTKYLAGDGTWKIAASAGRLVAFTVLTSGTSWTSTVNTNKILATLIGAGSGGAGGQSGGGFAGNGGNAGAMCMKFVAVSPNTAYTIAIGAGGSAGAVGSAGGTGGDTTLTIGGTTYTAHGAAWGSVAATAVNGDLNVPGATTSISLSASTPYGGGVSGSVAGNGYGAGGGGGPGNAVGGAGAPGLILIYEYS